MSRSSAAEETWDYQDLVRRLGRSVEIARRAVVVLACDSPTEDNGDAVPPEKVISEAALLLVMMAPAIEEKSELGKLHDSLARELIPYARGERMLAGLCLYPSLAHEYGFAHVCLTRLGYADPEVDRLFAESLRARSAGNRDLPPHGQMQSEWITQLWNGASSTSGRSRLSLLVRESILARPLDLLSSSREDLYAFTHALMFATDLGMRTMRFPRLEQDIIGDAESAVAFSLDKQDYDLAAEILLTWPLLRQPWTPTAAFAFATLAMVEDEAGFLPSPMTRVERYERLPKSQRSRYALATAYHTAFAMGLLCAAALRPGLTPPSSLVPVDGKRLGAGAALLRLIDRDLVERHWQRCLSQYLPEQQDQTAPLLLSIILRRAAESRDLEFLQAALQVGNEFSLATSPAAEQAVELLHRAAVFSPLASKSLGAAHAVGPRAFPG